MPKPRRSGTPAPKAAWSFSSAANVAATSFTPRLVCKACGSTELDWADAAGAGSLKSWTVIRRAVSAAFEADVPYVVALVELDEGPTMMANLVTPNPESLVMGQRVQVTFEPRGPELRVPQFQPEDGVT